MNMYLIDKDKRDVLPIECDVFLTAIIDFYDKDLDHMNIFCLRGEVEFVKFVPSPNFWYLTEDCDFFGVSKLMAEKFCDNNASMKKVEFLDQLSAPSSRGEGRVYNLDNIRGDVMKIRITKDQYQVLDYINRFSGYSLSFSDESQEEMDFTT